MAQVLLNLQIRLMLVSIVKVRVKGCDAWLYLKAGTTQIGRTGEYRSPGRTACNLIAEQAMPVYLCCVVEGGEAGYVIIHAICSVYDCLMAASWRPGETEARRDIGVIIGHAAGESVGRLRIEGGEKNGLVACANVDAEVGAETNLILCEKVYEVECDANIGVAAVRRKKGIGVGLACSGVDFAGDGVEVLVERVDCRTAILSGKSTEGKRRSCAGEVRE
jgi:hypothetical protein